MTFTASSSDLLDALKTAARPISGSVQMPVLEEVLATRENGLLVLRGTDLETHVLTRTAVDWNAEHAQGPAAATLPAKRLKKTLQSLPDTPVEVDVGDDYHVTLRTDQGTYETAGRDGQDFPDLPEIEDGRAVPAGELETAFQKTEPFTDHDGLRPAMEGVKLELKNGHPRAVATDGHRLSRLDLNLPSAGRDVVVPTKGVSLMQSVMREEATFEVGEGHVALDTGQTTVYSLLIDETFPNHEAVVPSNNNQILRVDRASFQSAAERVGLYAESETSQLRLKITSDQLQVSAQDVGRGAEAAETIGCEYDGEDMEIGFNAGYLAEVLGAAEGDEVEMRLGSPTDAATVHPSGDDDHLMLLMPVMLGK